VLPNNVIKLLRSQSIAQVVLNPVRRERSTYPNVIIIAHSSRVSFRWIMIARVNHEYPSRLTHIIYLLHCVPFRLFIFVSSHSFTYIYLFIYLFIYLLFIRLFMRVFISNCLCSTTKIYSQSVQNDEICFARKQAGSFAIIPTESVYLLKFTYINATDAI